MAEDLNFNKIIKELKEIHKAFPDRRFGEVVQKAVDDSRRKHNFDLHNLNSKEILTALETNREFTKNARKVK